MANSSIETTEHQQFTRDTPLPNFHVDLSDPTLALRTDMTGRLIDSLPVPDGLKALMPGTKEYESNEFSKDSKDAVTLARKIEKTGVRNEQVRHDLAYDVVEKEYFFGAVNNELKKDGLHLTITGTLPDGDPTDLNYDALTLTKTEKAGQTVLANIPFTTFGGRFGRMVAQDHIPP